MTRTIDNKTKIKYLIALHIELLILSLSGVCSKMAAQNQFLSTWWLFWYALVILNLGVYAIVWQQIIKYLPLTTAYANKAIGIVWGILWGIVIFGEQLKWNMIVGAVIVIIGVIVVVKSDE